MYQSILFTIICIINLENVIITESIPQISHTAEVCFRTLHIFPRKKCSGQKYISSRINIFDAANTFLLWICLSALIVIIHLGRYVSYFLLIIISLNLGMIIIVCSFSLPFSFEHNTKLFDYY